jgi:transglutaminase-like putative cysteine protease
VTSRPLRGAVGQTLTSRPLRGAVGQTLAATLTPLAPAVPQVAAPARAGFARLATFTLLGAFTGSAWGSNLLAPSGAGRAALMAVIAAAMGAAMLALAEVRNPVARYGGCAVAVLVAVGFMFEAAGVGSRLLVPDAWGDLAAGINQGIAALPQTTVPYQGVDEWVRTTILAGAGGLLLLAAGFAFWPRTAAARPTAAAVALGVIYGVPAVERNFAHPFLSGAVFALLLTAFLWGERLKREQAWITGALALVALSAGLIAAPRLDGARPLLDPQHLADPLAAKGDVFTWTHQYGPLDWPRDGREVLRVKAQTATYWKATNLVQFDGIRWREAATINPKAPDTEFAAGYPQWKQTIRVVVRALRSVQFITAGSAIDIGHTHKLYVPESPGTFVTGRTPLKPGDSYTALVYTPRPSQAQMSAAGTNYASDYTGDDLSMALPASVGGPRVENPFTGKVSDRYATDIIFPPYGDTTTAPLAVTPDASPSSDGDKLLRASAYKREYALAQQLVAQSDSPYDYVRRVIRAVRQGARYSEAPPLTKIPLDTFLFGKQRIGYCQQFSGATALLLRMGGVPARVASGFAPGSYDRKRKEYVVRDLDAHSWVEAYFPGYGWVPFDPTPSIAPARSQASNDDAASAAQGDARDKGGIGDRGSDPHAGGAGDGGGSPFKLPLIALAGLLLALTLVRVERRSRIALAPVDPELAELVRALRRSGRMPANDVTLARLETVLGGSDAAQGYLRAVREHRYGREDAPVPTREQRRALRDVLGAGLGPFGRLRGWWALPPRVLHSKAWPTSTSSSATGRAFWRRATSMLPRSR